MYWFNCPRPSTTQPKKWFFFGLKMYSRSSATESCLRNGLAFTDPEKCIGLTAPGPRQLILRNDFFLVKNVFQIHGNWELPKKWTGFHKSREMYWFNCPSPDPRQLSLRNGFFFVKNVFQIHGNWELPKKFGTRSRQPVYFWGWAAIHRFHQATPSCQLS